MRAPLHKLSRTPAVTPINCLRWVHLEGCPVRAEFQVCAEEIKIAKKMTRENPDHLPRAWSPQVLPSA